MEVRGKPRGHARLGKRGTAGWRHSGDEPRARGRRPAPAPTRPEKPHHRAYRRMIERRLRLGLVGAGRVPPRNRGAPTRRWAAPADQPTLTPPPGRRRHGPGRSAKPAFPPNMRNLAGSASLEAVQRSKMESRLETRPNLRTDTRTTEAAGQGLEPRLPDPESGVLPLDDPAKEVQLTKGRDRPCCPGP